MNSAKEFLLTIFQPSKHHQGLTPQLTEELNKLNCELNSHAPQTLKPSIYSQLKIEILRLCHVSMRYNKPHQQTNALSLLERGLKLSNILVNAAQEQGHYCAIIILSMMGEIYCAQGYNLLALASFKAAVEAYEALKVPDQNVKSHIAIIRSNIVSITEVTSCPNKAIEYYLDALWYLKTSERQPRARQVMKQLNNLCQMLQSDSLQAA